MKQHDDSWLPGTSVSDPDPGGNKHWICLFYVSPLCFREANTSAICLLLKDRFEYIYIYIYIYMFIYTHTTTTNNNNNNNNSNNIWVHTLTISVYINLGQGPQEELVTYQDVRLCWVRCLLLVLQPGVRLPLTLIFVSASMAAALFQRRSKSPQPSLRAARCGDGSRKQNDNHQRKLLGFLSPDDLKLWGRKSERSVVTE